MADTNISKLANHDNPSKWLNPAGTLEYRNGTESFFGLKGRPSVVRDVKIHNQPILRMRRK